MTDSTKPQGIAYIPRSQVPTGVEREATFESFYGGKNHPGNFSRLSMKHKVSELEGALLDAAVAKAEGWHQVGDWWCSEATEAEPLGAEERLVESFEPSQLWDDGGQMIQRERMYLEPTRNASTWRAFHETRDGRKGTVGDGPTPLIAAMRAYVAIKLSDEVELP